MYKYVHLFLIEWKLNVIKSSATGAGGCVVFPSKTVVVALARNSPSAIPVYLFDLLAERF
jgi:hypothetical protein